MWAPLPRIEEYRILQNICEEDRKRERQREREWEVRVWMASLVVQKPWKAEYAKSSRSSCKTCKTPIDKEVLRLGKMVQATQFDGFMPVNIIFHLLKPFHIFLSVFCFFIKYLGFSLWRLCYFVSDHGLLLFLVIFILIFSTTLSFLVPCFRISTFYCCWLLCCFPSFTILVFGSFIYYIIFFIFCIWVFFIYVNWFSFLYYFYLNDHWHWLCVKQFRLIIDSWHLERVSLVFGHQTKPMPLYGKIYKLDSRKHRHRHGYNTATQAISEKL